MPNKAYDIKDVITEVVDNGTFYELFQNYAQNLVTGFARMNGATVGILANQPKYKAGFLRLQFFG